MTATLSERYPFTPFPTGWFWLASTAEVVAGELVTRKIFGQEVVVFRDADGQPRMMDAYCPHLGAHLGHGGRVVNGTVVCPFHGWNIDADGRVIDIPYSDRKPPKVCVRTWPLLEQDGQILVWHDNEGRPPTWQPPPIPEASDPEWTGLRPAKRWRIRTHIQELAENGFDNAHFPYLHDQQTQVMRTEGIDVDGAHLVHRTWQRFNIFGLAKLFTDEVSGPLHIHYHGLGIYVNRATVQSGIELNYAFVFYAVPVDEHGVEFVSFLSMKRIGGPLATELLWRKAAKEGGVTIDQDVPIWENKRYLTRPVLVSGDGPIHKFRKWARQFHEGAPLADAAGAAK